MIDSALHHDNSSVLEWMVGKESRVSSSFAAITKLAGHGKQWGMTVFEPRG